MIEQKTISFVVTKYSISAYETRIGDKVICGNSITELIFNAGYWLVRFIVLEFYPIEEKK